MTDAELSSQDVADIRATMTPEELDAIDSVDLDEADRQELARIAAEDNEESEEPEAAAPEVSGQEKQVEAAKDVEEVQKPVLSTPAFTPQAPPQTFQPREAVDPLAAQIDALKVLESDVRQRFKDGEIDMDERDDELSKLSEKRSGLLVQQAVRQAKAEMAAEMAQRAEADNLQARVNDFMAKVKESTGGAVDYAANATLAKEFDLVVRVLANDEKNDDKPLEWFLEEANKRVIAYHQIPQAPAPKNVISLEDAKNKRKPRLDSVPPTLAHMQGAGVKNEIRDDYDFVDNLWGLDIEAAIARMSPEQREKFGLMR